MKLSRQSINQWIMELTRQSINQAIEQSINQSVMELTRQSMSKALKSTSRGERYFSAIKRRNTRRVSRSDA
jgi:hypothetical protein